MSSKADADRGALASLQAALSAKQEELSRSYGEFIASKETAEVPHVGVADGMSIARAWACRYSK